MVWLLARPKNLQNYWQGDTIDGGDTIDSDDTIDAGVETIEGSVNFSYEHTFLNKNFEIYEFIKKKPRKIWLNMKKMHEKAIFLVTFFGNITRSILSLLTRRKNSDTIDEGELFHVERKNTLYLLEWYVKFFRIMISMKGMGLKYTV